MNALVTIHPATLRLEISRLASTAHTLNRIGVQRKQWAREAERQGKLDLARRYADQAAEKRAHALWHIHHAQARKDSHYG